jgi:hypothetical protein
VPVNKWLLGEKGGREGNLEKNIFSGANKERLLGNKASLLMNKERLLENNPGLWGSNLGY